ncbi:aldehyde dehydrogenase family protein [Marinoscillum sp. MHG1-6]|uniref:aldehyde dehydrogenase family protein n=1 Tax=Marinoscillum sp. MHG1-6 TaxID=2959627 RepID=UPI002157B0B7|nr:aldehyde dehydrogenase family protein [Marinoscillum sp. MHG1-6]
MNIINPSNGRIIENLKEDDLNSVHKKLVHLRATQKVWSTRTVKERLAVIEKFGELVKQNREELAQILTSETGKPIRQARGEVMGSLNRITHLKSIAEKWLSEEQIVKEGGTLESIRYEPLGVIANISAWNFPYNVGYNVFLYALVAGNGVFYKPSEYATMTGLKFKTLLEEAGLPEGLFEVVIGKGDVGQLLLEEDIDGYFFTGSYKTGVHIAKEVASKLVPVQLELGGKDPLYVMDDVPDIKVAAANAAEGAFYNNGQSCCAVERLYVHEKIYDEFVSYFVDEVKGYMVGDPLQENTFIGPLTREPQIQVIIDQVKDAVDKGAQLVLGGDRVEGSGYYMAPTILTNVNHDMDVMRDESFGPIIGIQKVASDEEALELMNDTEYGLTAAAFSVNEARANNLLEKVNVGTVYWNCCDRVSPFVPWSGRKNSGLGATLSYMGIRAFTQPKAYHIRK